jgi:hypothetical protein
VREGVRVFNLKGWGELGKNGCGKKYLCMRWGGEGKEGKEGKTWGGKVGG